MGGTAIPKVLLPESAIPYYAIVGNRYYVVYAITQSYYNESNIVL